MKINVVLFAYNKINDYLCNMKQELKLNHKKQQS